MGTAVRPSGDAALFGECAPFLLPMSDRVHLVIDRRPAPPNQNHHLQPAYVRWRGPGLRAVLQSGAVADV
jgi:hypothetical protein